MAEPISSDSEPMDEWESYTTYEYEPEKFPNLLKRFKIRGLDNAWKDSVKNGFTHSFFHNKKRL